MAKDYATTTLFRGAIHEIRFQILADGFIDWWFDDAEEQKTLVPTDEEEEAIQAQLQETANDWRHDNFDD